MSNHNDTDGKEPDETTKIKYRSKRKQVRLMIKSRRNMKITEV